MSLYKRKRAALAEDDSELGRLARDENALKTRLKSASPWILLVAGTLAAIPAGIWIDEHTRLDLELLFLYFTAIGALVAATFTTRQALETRRHTDLALRPYLVMEGHRKEEQAQVGDRGIVVTVRNHGSGLAYEVEWTATLLRGSYEAWPDANALRTALQRTRNTTHAIGAGSTVRIPILAWPLGFIPPSEVCTLLVEFVYRSVTGIQESNFQSMMFDFSVLADVNSSKTINKPRGPH